MKKLTGLSLLLTSTLSFWQKTKVSIFRFLHILGFMSFLLFSSLAYGGPIEQDFDFKDAQNIFEADLKAIKEGNIDLALNWIPTENTPKLEKQVAMQYSYELIQAIEEGERRNSIRMAHLLGVETEVPNTIGTAILQAVVKSLSQPDSSADCYGTVKKINQ